ncbi:MAG: hypothetical protein ACFB14_06490 [Leptolyngbyaceae cyanobacterium]
MVDGLELVLGKRIGGRWNVGRAYALGVVLEHGFGRLFDVDNTPLRGCQWQEP